MIKVIPVIFVSLLLLRRSLFLHKLTSYNLFFIGIVLFIQFGYLLAFTDATNNYVLKGDTTLLDNIYLEVVYFSALSAVPLFFQKECRDDIGDVTFFVTGKKTFVYQYIVMLILLFLMAGVSFEHAPLFNIGTYSFEEMSEARSEFYGSSFSEATAVIRYLTMYLLIPSLFFLRGYGLRINRFPLFCGILVSLLTLSKTAATLLIVFYFLGRYSRTDKIRYLVFMFLSSVLTFYTIVFATYFVSERRGFVEVLYIFVKRLLVIPVSLTAFYADRFDFSDGYRSSSIYVSLFGGHIEGISKVAGEMITGIPINSPTGIIGMAYPNIPPFLHLAYFVFFILYVAVISRYAASIRNNITRNVMSVLFGMCCWFILLTDPLTALNSYGGLYMSGIILLIFSYQTLPLVIARRSEFYKTFNFNRF